jgi:hypothetical protein
VSTILIVAIGAAPRSASAAPIIQEVFYDAAGPDATGVFTELFGPAGMLLDGGRSSASTAAPA